MVKKKTKLMLYSTLVEHEVEIVFKLLVLVGAWVVKKKNGINATLNSR